MTALGAALAQQLVERASSAGLASGDAEHHQRGERGPGHSQGAVRSVMVHGKNDGGLHGQVGGEREEGDTDHSQRTTLALGA